MPHREAESPLFAVRQFMLDHLKAGSGTTDQNIMGVSPIAIPENPADHSRLLVETLYGDRLSESLFVGETTDTFVRPAFEWLDAFRRGQRIGKKGVRGGHQIPQHLGNLSLLEPRLRRGPHQAQRYFQ
jgi:hypothetical protein